MMTEQKETAPRASKPVLWGIAFVGAMFGTAFAAKVLHFGPYAIMGAMAAPMLLLIPFVRSTEALTAARGCSSPAVRRYNRRSLIWAFSYVVALMFAITVFNSLQPTGPLLWLLALLPSLPILYLVWTMGRYLAEETDEYLRMRTVHAALFATGLLLSVATIWGFLENFGVVPHVQGWAAMPVWALGLGLGHFVNRWRGA